MTNVDDTSRTTAGTRAGTNRPAVLRFDDVTVARDGTRVLAGVQGAVPEGQVTVVAGPSGAGKTSLLRLCNRLDVPDSGRVIYRGRDVAELDPLRLRRQVGMVFQTARLLPGTVADNLRVAVPEADRDRMAQTLERVSLPPSMLDRPGDRLSGGEAQRACLARTLITGSDVLLADEPTSALDPTPKLAFERLTRRLAGDGLTVVWVTHDLDQLRRLADHVLVLIEGQVRYEGHLDGLERRADLAAFLKGDPDASR